MYYRNSCLFVTHTGSDNINNKSYNHGLVELNRNNLAINNSGKEAASTFPDSSELSRLLSEKGR